MNEEIDDFEFYQQDFTTASEWEIFIARIEQIVNEWKTDDPSPPNTGIWMIKTDSLRWADSAIQLSLYKKGAIISDNEDKTPKFPIDPEYTFELYNETNDIEHSCLSRWYGIDQYAVLYPDSGVVPENCIQMVLSSVYVAVGNLKCDFPIFVQIKHKQQQLYMGVYENQEIRTKFEMVHLHRALPRYRYLIGLLDLFRSKMDIPLGEPITSALQATYVLTDFGTSCFKRDSWNSEIEATIPNILPFGVDKDPIQSIILKTSWRNTSHKRLADDETSTYCTPENSNHWTLLRTLSHEGGAFLLSKCLTEIFLFMCGNTASVYEILGDFLSTPEINNPLDSLTEPKVPTISTLLSKTRGNLKGKSKKGPAPISDEILMSILYFLFPDADQDTNSSYSDQHQRTPEEKNIIDLAQECRGFKTCSFDSLLWRLSIALAHALNSLGDPRAFAHLWHEFVQEMRYRWENAIFIPGMSLDHPDLRTNLLHQKIQMLNCCIKRRRMRDAATLSVDSTGSASSSADEEFFDCEEQQRIEKHSLWNQPKGRLEQSPNLKLIKNGDPLFIPITQEPVPKTEDQLEEDTDVLLNLGSDAQASEMRAKMMSASLLSDMESFKAANPGAILEDFIRWYSPRDWVESDELDEWEQKKGELSSRMQLKDNFWMQTWNLSKPVPANRQKRLFDDTREAEKILHFLDSRTMEQVCEMIVPILAHASVYRIADELKVLLEYSNGEEAFRNLIKSGERLSRDKYSDDRFDNFIQEVASLELKISEVNSLQRKFNPSGVQDETVSKVICDLVSGQETKIEGAAESNLGQRLTYLFSKAVEIASLTLDPPVEKKNAKFPKASERQFVMRLTVPRPEVYSVPSPQYLRAIVGETDFRLCGAFSEDILYY